MYLPTYLLVWTILYSYFFFFFFVVTTKQTKPAVDQWRPVIKFAYDVDVREVKGCWYNAVIPTEIVAPSYDS